MISTAAQVVCPKCGQSNLETAHFCTVCHQVLIHRCPKCWHEQRAGSVCEKCGTCFALYWEMALERAMEEEDRVWWAKLGAALKAFVQILTIPFLSLGAILRMLVIRLLAIRSSGR
jgi:predicted RNA-binding Zn-ribbon protein involved in translation (DUF1610 family)